MLKSHRNPMKFLPAGTYMIRMQLDDRAAAVPVVKQ